VIIVDSTSYYSFDVIVMLFSKLEDLVTSNLIAINEPARGARTNAFPKHASRESNDNISGSRLSSLWALLRAFVILFIKGAMSL
jgi:hypothetical protein